MCHKVLQQSEFIDLAQELGVKMVSELKALDPDADPLANPLNTSTQVDKFLQGDLGGRSDYLRRRAGPLRRWCRLSAAHCSSPAHTRWRKRH